MIAVVGGGGKTSLIYRLNEELQALGKKVIIYRNSSIWARRYLMPLSR
ncbi:MAG: hypothetical protein ACLVBP_16925 [Ruminococcus sp.]